MKTTFAKIRLVLVAGLALGLIDCSKSGGGGGSSSSPANSCSNGTISTNAGCLQTCGTSNGQNLVISNGQCVPASSVISNSNNGTNASNICSVGCGTGQVMTAMGCMQTSPSCGTCYGQNNGACYIGNNAHVYYGY